MPKLFRSCCSLMLCLMLLFTFAATAAAADTESSLAGLRVRFRVTVPALDDAVFTLWANGTAFAVGDAQTPAAYYVTDAALLDYEYVLSGAASSIITMLEDGGIAGVTAENLINELEVDSMETVLYTQDTERAVTLVTAEDGWALLGIASAADYVEAPVLSISTVIPTGDVTYWSCGDTPFGITTSTPPSAGFLRLSGSIASITGESVSLTTDFTALNQGSPLVDSSGAAFAVVVTDSDSDTVSAVGLSSLQDALVSIGVLEPIPETLSDKTEALAETASFRRMIMYATLAAGVLLILIIVLLIVRSRRPAAEAAAGRQVAADHRYSAPRAAAAAVRREPVISPTPAARVPAPAAKPAATVTPAAAPANAPAAPVRVRPAAAPVQPEKTPVTYPDSVLVTVVSGHLQGNTVHVSGTAGIGRDPKVCSVVFGATQTEISRHHCQLTYKPDSGEIILEDLNSANGTYTPDGRRYAAGRKYLLRSGDRFYLGLKENMLEVRL